MLKVDTTEALKAALASSAVETIVLTAGVFSLTDSELCGCLSGYPGSTVSCGRYTDNVIEAGLCLNRSVTIEAEQRGAAVLHGMWERRVLSVGPAADVKLIGLSITGGRALEYWNHRNLSLIHI